MITIAAIIAWIEIGKQVFDQGREVWDKIKPILIDHGIDADNAELDAAFVDAEARRERARRDADGE